MATMISLPMPRRLAHYVIASALESSCGSRYWLRDYKHQPAEHLGRYVWLQVSAPKKGAECDIAPKHSRIDATRIAAALSEMLQTEEHAERAGRVIAQRGDAPDADAVLQFAAFGEVVYG